jgi:WD40 repeat protein
LGVSADGRRVLLGMSDGKVNVWGTSPRPEKFALPLLEKLPPNGRNVRSVATDGRRIVAVSGHYLKIWDAATGRELVATRKEVQLLRSIALSPDGKDLVTFSVKDKDASLMVWDAATGEPLRTLPIPVPAGADQGMFPGYLTVAYTADGRHIVGAHDTEGAVTVWDAATLKALRSFSVGKRLKAAAEYACVAISPDGRRVARGIAGDTNGSWTVLDLETGRCGTPVKAGAIKCLAFGPNGHDLISGHAKGEVIVWDAATGKQRMVFKGHGDDVTGLAMSKDGQRVVSASTDGTARLWDVATGQEKLILKNVAGPLAGFGCVAISPDGRQILVGGARDATVRVWEAAPPESDRPPRAEAPGGR